MTGSSPRNLITFTLTLYGVTGSGLSLPGFGPFTVQDPIFGILTPEYVKYNTLESSANTLFIQIVVYSASEYTIFHFDDSWVFPGTPLGAAFLVVTLQ